MSSTRASPNAHPAHGGADRTVPGPVIHADPGYGPTLALAVVIGFAAFLVAMPLLLLVVHPRVVAGINVGQNQTAKTALYLATFVVILPVSLIAARRWAGAIAAGPNRSALNALSALLVASLALVLIAIRLSHGLPWGDGLGVVLAGAVAWSLLAAGALRRAGTARPWPLVQRLVPFAGRLVAFAGAVVFAALLCVTNMGGLSVTAVAVGAIALVAVALAYERLRLPHSSGPAAFALDAIVVVILVLAIPDLVVFTSSSGLPSIYFEPGVIQFQQDWILGPANQVLGGGALLVGAPSSQYGVGLVYALVPWFHVVPIGYGTFALLDGALTALFYGAGYLVLRLAGVGRLLATASLAVAVAVFIYGMHFSLGALPEQGPLRFGMPMAVLLLLVAGARAPRRERVTRAAALVVVGLSSIWAAEAFGYTTVTFVVVAALQASFRDPAARGSWFRRQLALALGACVSAHVLFAIATLIASGELPHWSQYLAYVRGLLLGGKEGAVTYGFQRWSPGLAVAALGFVSAAALILLMLQRRAFAVRERVTTTALAGSTAYAIASFSYADNRSSTYLLLYIALPVLMTGVLWLSLLLRSGSEVPRGTRVGGLVFACAVAILMLGADWSAIGPRFSRSALAHAYPGGGLRAAVHRLMHAPPIDPRSPEGESLTRRYLPGRHVLVLLPTEADLGIEIMMRSGRSSALFIGDPREDAYIPSVWMPRLERQIAELRPGQRILTSVAGLRIAASLRGRPPGYALAHRLEDGSSQLEWVLHQIDERFTLRPIARGSYGYVVTQLVARPP